MDSRRAGMFDLRPRRARVLDRWCAVAARAGPLFLFAAVLAALLASR